MAPPGGVLSGQSGFAGDLLHGLSISGPCICPDFADGDRAVERQPRLAAKGAPAMPEVNSVVAICENRSQAEKAMKELQKAGFDMNKVSVVGDASTGRVMIVCDAPWAQLVKGLSSQRARALGFKISRAA
jgi:hypothetical protein